MTEIDFLPSEYWKRRQSRRDQWYLLAMGLASLFPLLSSFLHESKNNASLRGQIANLESEYQDVLVQVEQVERLKTQCAPLAFDARFNALLVARPSLSRVTTAIAASCPQNLSLSSVRIRPVKVAKPASLPPRTASPTHNASDPLVEQLELFTNDRQGTRLFIELAGVAESDLDVAELIERLERAGCFRDIHLAAVDYQTVGTLEARHFKIQCRLAEVL